LDSRGTRSMTRHARFNEDVGAIVQSSFSKSQSLERAKERQVVDGRSRIERRAGGILTDLVCKNTDVVLSSIRPALCANASSPKRSTNSKRRSDGSKAAFTMSVQPLTSTLTSTMKRAAPDLASASKATKAAYEMTRSFYV
jgi:hypothetical protein